MKDTIAFYSVPGRRAVRPCGGLIGAAVGCVYSPTDSSPGCAVGRFIPNKLTCVELDSSGSSVAIDTRVVEAMGPLAALDPDFLRLVQRLHDASYHWHYPGSLSELGKERVRDICLIHNLSEKEVLGDLTTE